MRNCSIQINNDGSVNVSDCVDYVGEHRATQLSVQLNSELTADNISYYTLSFKPGAALKNPPSHKLTSDMIPKTELEADTLFYRLPAALTCFGSLDIQVLAHCLSDTNEVTEIIKSPVFRILFNPSISGDDEIFIEEAQNFTALIHTALAQLNLTLDEADELCDKINEAYENGELNGTVIIPHIDNDGTLSWSNDAGLENPQPINLKGEKGDKGDTGKSATINGYNAVTINTGGDLEITQDGENITLSCNSVKFYNTLPTAAEDGEVCLYSPINTLTPADSGKPIYINYSDLLNAIDTDYAAFNLLLYDADSEEIGHIYATSFFENEEKIKYFDVVFNEKRWFVHFTNNEFIPQKSFFEQNGEREMLFALPKYFELPHFSGTEITYDTSSGNVFYAPPRLMFYHGDWYEFNPLSHTHENYNTLDCFSCNALDNPITEGDFNFGINTEDWNRLKFRGDTVLFNTDGAVVQKIEEKEIDGQKYLRVTLHKPGLNLGTGGGLPSFFDIPVKSVEEKGDVSLNGAGLGLVLGGGASYDRIELTAESATLEPNTNYSFGESATLTLEFAEGDAAKVNEYTFTFVSGETPTVLTLPSSVQWANELTVEANKRYEISVVDNIGLWCAIEVSV